MPGPSVVSERAPGKYQASWARLAAACLCEAGNCGPLPNSDTEKLGRCPPLAACGNNLPAHRVWQMMAAVPQEQSDGKCYSTHEGCVQ